MGGVSITDPFQTETTTTTTTNITTEITTTSTTSMTTVTTEETVSATTTGDVNNDGSFTVADVVLMQKWLLSESDTILENWKAGDLCEDNIINVFDLCMMKQKIIDKSE